MAHRVVALVTVVASLLATTAHAQGIAASFAELRLLVRQGDTVTVRDAAGQQTQGKILKLSPTSITLAARGATVDVKEADTAVVFQRRQDPLGNGAKWGLGIGAGFGLLAGGVLCGEVEGCGGFVLGIALVYGGLGAGVGAGVDALVTRPQPIFARGSSSARVRFAPIAGPSRQGLTLSMRF